MTVQDEIEFLKSELAVHGLAGTVGPPWESEFRKGVFDECIGTSIA
jgi:hypothetical protein